MRTSEEVGSDENPILVRSKKLLKIDGKSIIYDSSERIKELE